MPFQNLLYHVKFQISNKKSFTVWWEAYRSIKIADFQMRCNRGILKSNTRYIQLNGKYGSELEKRCWTEKLMKRKMRFAGHMIRENIGKIALKRMIKD